MLAGCLMVWTLPAEAAELQVLDRLQVDGNTISPYGGIGRYENLLIYSEAFDDATSGTNWAETNMAGTANSTAAPNGTTTADTLTVQTASPGQTQQVVTTTVTLPYAFSVWAKSGTTTDLQLELTTNGTGATTDNATFVLTSIWQRYSVTKSAGAGTSPTTVTARIKSAGLVGQTLYVWGAQLEQSATVGVYVRTTTSTVAASQGAVTDGVATASGAPAFSAITTGTNATTLTMGTGGTLTTSGSGVINANQFKGTSTIAVADGGTGVGTFTANGLLYGNTTSALQVTAQGAANTVLTANAGAPAFSAAPTIGTSVTTPLLLGGTTTTSPLTLKTTTGVGTTNADMIFQVGNNGATEAMRILNSGNVGIGTASPGQKLHVEGQCVTGDTLLAIVEDQKAEGFVLTPIVEVQPGDDVLSLNEETGKLEPRRIKGLLDMGIQPVFRLTTESGRTIRTTGNHPYLTKAGWRKVVELALGEEIAAPRTISGRAFSWLPGDEKYTTSPRQRAQSPQCQSTLRSLLTSSFLRKDDVCRKKERDTGNHQRDPQPRWQLAKEFTRQRDSKDRFRQITEVASGKFPVRIVKPSRLLAHHHQVYPLAEHRSSAGFLSLPVAEAAVGLPQPGAWSVKPGTASDPPNSKLLALSSDIVWDRIISIESVGREPVYDIEVEGTHNFVAGHWLRQGDDGSWIVDDGEEQVDGGVGPRSSILDPRSSAKRVFGGLIAHNTYLKGATADNTAPALNVVNSGSTSLLYVRNDGTIGIGTASPTALLHEKGTLSSALTGTVSVTAGTAAVTGVGTAFTTELAVGDALKIGTETFTVAAIGSATALTLSANHVAGASGATAYRDPTLLAIDNGAAVNKLTVTRSGNVGIGTTSPGAALSVVGITSGSSWGVSASDRIVSVFSAAPPNQGSTYLVLNNTVGAANMSNDLAFASNGTIKWVFGNDLNANGGQNLFMYDIAAGKARLIVDSSGNVGIGSTTKLSRLTVTPGADVTNLGGTTTASAATTITGSGTTFTTSLGIGDRLALSSAASTYATVTAIASDTSLTVDTALGNGTSQTINAKRSIFRLDDAANATKLTVNDLGNVGIGTASPSATLNVLATGTGFVNTATFEADPGDTGDLGNDAVTIRINNKNSTNYKSSIRLQGNGSTKWEIGNDINSSGAQQFFIWNGVSSTNPFAIHSNGGITMGGYNYSNTPPANGLIVSGNVGIGTASPTAALHIKAGTATANTAPLKLTAGTNLTTPEAGAVEFDGTNLTYTNSTPTRVTLATTTGGIALSSLTAAGTTNTLANTNNAQIWNWDTLSTQTALALNASGASALTTGTILDITTPSTAINSTNGLLRVANTGAGTTGILARLQSNSTAGSGLTVLANGNVGIGTTSPTNAKLHLAGTDSGGYAATIRLQNQNASGADAFIAASDANWTAGSNKMLFGLGGAPSSANTKMVIDSSGNVGIGTASPASVLQVAGTITAPQIISPSSTNLLITSPGGTGITIDADNTTVGTVTLDDTVVLGGNVGIGGSTKLSRLTVTPPADAANIGGTTTANASQTITGSGTTFLSSVGVGDRIALSSAASTYATVTHITSNTSLRVDVALGNGTSQTINKKSSFLRLDDTASVAHLLVNDQGITSINSVKLGAPLLPDNAGAVSWIDVPVTSSATSGTVESYTAQIDSQPLLTIYAKSDGVGGIQNSGVGIGTASPVSILHVAASTGVITIDSAGTPGESAVSGRASRSTLASPAAVQLNDRIFRLTARGYGTTTFGTTDNASVVLAAAEAFTDTAKGTYIALETTPLGTTSRTERVRIDNAGNVGIAMTSPGVKFQVNGGVSIATLGASGSTSHYLCIQQNSPATGYNYISDCGASLGALKTDIQPISEGLSTLMQLEPVQYKWKSTGEPDIGFIAEDVQRVSPTYLAAYNADGSLYGVNYIHFSAVLAKAIQELNGLAVKRDSNGNVGIGTTSPSFLLSLGNAADQTFGMEDQGVNTTAGRSLTVQAGAGGSSGTGNVGGSLTLKAGIAQGSAANAGGALILTPGTSTSTGATGYVQLSGGAAGAHFRATQTTAPTIGTPTSCGTSPSATITAGSTDMAGRLNITAGSGSPGNCAAVITFDQAYAAAPKAILLTPLTTNGPARNIWVSATAAGTCTVTMATAPAASQANSWYYLVIE